MIRPRDLTRRAGNFGCRMRHAIGAVASGAAACEKVHERERGVVIVVPTHRDVRVPAFPIGRNPVGHCLRQRAHDRVHGPEPGYSPGCTWRRVDRVDHRGLRNMHVDWPLIAGSVRDSRVHDEPDRPVDGCFREWQG